MKQLFLFTLILLISNISIFCQNPAGTEFTTKLITPLKNNSFEIMEFTKDSLLIYKGTLSSIEPDVRQGKFYFYDNKGKVIVTGLYKGDIPYGNWVYYDKNYDTLKTVNYTAVWNYLANDALDYNVDSTVLSKFKKKDRAKMNPDGTFYEVDKLPKFNKGELFLEFNKYINENLVYPVYAARKEISGEFDIQFVIDSKGKIRKPVILSPILSDLSIEAFRILTESKAWEPGYQNDMPVNVIYSWSFIFSNWKSFSLKLSTLKKAGAIDSLGFNEEDVYFTVEDMPTFNGGDPAREFGKYIFQNLRWPKGVDSKPLSGMVVIKFIINSKGKLIKPEIVVSAGYMLDQEVIRLVNSSPLWKPGYQNGKPVNVVYTIPIKFDTRESNF
jgi:TonB family protein